MCLGRYLCDVLRPAEFVDELVERVGRQAAAEALDGAQQLLLHAARALDGRPRGRRAAGRACMQQHIYITTYKHILVLSRDIFLIGNWYIAKCFWNSLAYKCNQMSYSRITHCAHNQWKLWHAIKQNTILIRHC